MPDQVSIEEAKSLIIDESMTYKPAVIAALKRFKDMKTWKSEVTDSQRLAAFQQLANDLLAAYELNVVIPVIRERDWNPEEGERQTDDRIPIIPIVFPNKLSIITFLHQFAGIRAGVSDFQGGLTPLGRQRWAVNLFRKVYPRQFAKLLMTQNGSFIKEGDATAYEESGSLIPDGGDEGPGPGTLLN